MQKRILRKVHLKPARESRECGWLPLSREWIRPMPLAMWFPGKHR